MYFSSLWRKKYEILPIFFPEFGKDGMDLDVEIHPPNFKFDLEDNEEGLVNHLENEIFEKIISTPDTQQFQPPKRGRGRPRKQICVS